MPKDMDLEKLRSMKLDNIADLLEAKEEDEDEKDEDQESDSSEGDDKDEDKDKDDMEESVAELFKGVEGLDEAFVKKAKDVFTIAVSKKTQELVESRLADLDKTIGERLAEQQEESDKQINSYLNYVVEEWLKENQVAITSNIKAEKYDQLMESLGGLFTEHHVDVESVDKLQEAQAEITSLKSEVLDLAEKLQESKDEVVKQSFRKVIAEATEGMADTEKETFISAIGELDVELTESVEDFTARISGLKKIFVKQATEEKVNESDDEKNEEVILEKEEQLDESKDATVKDEKMASYLKSVRRGFKGALNK